MFNARTSATVEKLLRDNVATRSDDILLILKVWEQEGLTLTPEQTIKFRQVSKPETIRRTRQKIQEERYKPDTNIYKARHELAHNTRSTIAKERIAEIDQPQGKCPTCRDTFPSVQHLAAHIIKVHQRKLNV
jgi:hypothetical protein